jgi:very-short-patch-repair endonuclease
LKKGGRGDLKISMLKYNANLKSKARQIRQNLTDSERALWQRLRGKQLTGIQFYRQKPIGKYIVDFYAPKAKLVIELDGSQHLEAHHIEKDRERDEYFDRLGLMVLRFNSRQILKETDAIMEFIYRKIAERIIE